MNDLDFTLDIKNAKERIRQVEVDGQVFILQATDPYGFWDVSPAKGSKPDILQGYFTDYQQAVQACSLAADAIKRMTKVAEAEAPKKTHKRISSELRD